MQKGTFSLEYIMEYSNSIEVSAEEAIDLAIAVLAKEKATIELNVLDLDNLPEKVESVVELIRSLSQKEKLDLLLNSNEKRRWTTHTYNDVIPGLASQLVDFVRTSVPVDPL